MEFFRFLRHIISGRRAGLLRLRPVKGPIRLECIGCECGLCCSHLGGTFVTAEEAPPLQELNAVEEVDGKLRLHGSCCVLLKGKACSGYEFRPRGCKEYPWYNNGGELYCDKGCPGIRYDSDERPEAETLRPADVYFLAPRPTRSFLLWLLGRW